MLMILMQKVQHKKGSRKFLLTKKWDWIKGIGLWDKVVVIYNNSN